MTASALPAATRSTGWFPVARAAEVGTAPLSVAAGGQAYVVVRLRPGAEVSAYPARCPHRLVPLAAGTVVDGRLTCRRHGWQFDADGRCVAIPALGVDGVAPPRADLPVPWAVEERHGWVWLAPDRTATAVPPRPSVELRPEPLPSRPAPDGPVLGNLHPSLARAWHPVALSAELRPGGWLQVRLGGRTWSVSRGDDGLLAAPPAYDVGERYGLVWLAPERPAAKPLHVPELADPHAAVGRLAPVRAAGPAATLLDTLLDGTTGVVHPEPGGFSAVREPAPGAPHRTTTVVRVPFGLRRRVEDPVSGAASTLVVVLQPEDADSTRAHARLFLSAGPGRPLPAPEEVAAAVAAEQAALAAAAGLQRHLGSAGLPLRPRAELHLPADAPGVALRRAAAGFVRAAPGR